MPSRIHFVKMHGTGNDFVIIDTRAQEVPARLDWQRLADRRHGIGCDQLILLEPSTKAKIRMRILNADGGEVSACGNATRCVASLLMTHSRKERITIETKAGLLTAERGDGGVTVGMGRPRLKWNEIPVLADTDLADIKLMDVPLPGRAVAVGMGNPHLVVFVDAITDAMVHNLGPLIESHMFFPERTNVEFVEVLSKRRLKLRVWERGVGETLACGTGACAAVVAAHHIGLAERKATVQLPGGQLEIEWQAEDKGGEVLLCGQVATAFRGEFNVAAYAL